MGFPFFVLLFKYCVSCVFKFLHSDICMQKLEGLPSEFDQTQLGIWDYSSELWEFHSSGTAISSKTRIRRTPKLHEKFVECVNRLGGANNKCCDFEYLFAK